MKKTFLILFVLMNFLANGQVHKHAIGLRGGSGGYYGYGPEISYQLGLNDINRVEFDLGWYSRKNWNNGNGWGSGNAYRLIAFTASYHWTWNLIEGLNWYVGPGAQLTIYNERNFDHNDGLFIGVGGQIGLEYDFSQHDVPLHVGLDYRPMFLFSWYDDVGHGAALSLRYLID